jgi:L-threonylcarbamoyladenylate synthase
MKPKEPEKTSLHLDLAEVYPPTASETHRRAWSRLVGILRSGGVALLPTDTIYGLHARWDDSGARARILDLKGRSEAAPMLSIVGSREMLDLVIPELPPAALKLMEKHWPGSLTMVLPAGPVAPAPLVVDGGIALRWPGEAFLTDLVLEVGLPLISTSANLSGSAAVSLPSEIPSSWKHTLDAVVDGGQRTGPPSTLIRVRPSGSVMVLRQGSHRLDPADLGEG